MVRAGTRRSRAARRLRPPSPASTGDALVCLVQSAFAGTDDALALAEAQRLVARRPVPAELLALLAAAQVKAGQAEAAAQTIQIARQRGWREPTTQEAVLRIALASGDRSEAARRYIALFLRNQTPDEVLVQLGAEVLGGPDEAGRQAMLAVVVGAERWRSVFLRRGVRVMPPAAFSEVAVASIERGVVFDCPVLGLSLAELGRRDAVAAERLARAAAGSCPQAVASPR